MLWKSELTEDALQLILRARYFGVLDTAIPAPVPAASSVLMFQVHDSPLRLGVPIQ